MRQYATHEEFAASSVELAELYSGSVVHHWKEPRVMLLADAFDEANESDLAEWRRRS